ncbi:hypothetical protein JCM5350_000536 [Sporobolomyces pararoseus]
MQPNFRRAGLAQLVVQILPHLPNLRAILGLKSHHIQDLLGASGFKSSGGVPAKLQHTRARQVLSELASKITEWHLEVSDEDLDVLLSFNKHNIKRLGVTSPHDNGFRTLDLEDSPLPRILDKLDNLESLSLVELNLATSNLHLDPSLQTNLYQQALEFDYSFRSTLHSLSLSLESTYRRTDINFLKIAAHFPHLSHFHLAFSFSRLELEDAFNSVSLPNLRNHELEAIEVESASSLFSALHLPLLLTVTISKISGPHNEAQTRRQQLENFGKTLSSNCSNPYKLNIVIDHRFDNGKEIETIKKWLDPMITFSLSRAPSLNRPRQIARRRQMEYYLSDSESDIDLVIEDEEEEEEEEEQEHWHGQGGDVEDGEVPDLSVDPVFERTNEILGWASECAADLKARDKAGGKHFLKLLGAVHHWREWMED